MTIGLDDRPLTIRVATRLAAVARADWNRCASGGNASVAASDEPPESGCEETPDNPFISYDFLMALEVSGCVGGRSGWQSAHVLVETSGGELIAAAPCYIKGHSQGEYVFDHAWADAFHRAGGQYYPKLQVAVPFTPVTGPRLLVAAGPQAERAEAALVQGLEALQSQSGASSTHVTFATLQDWQKLGEADFLLREDQQFHWLNEDYGSFDDFLAALSSRKRKVIKRERRDALASDIAIETVTGAAITEAHWDAFFEFYMDTGSRKWGRPYLNRKFFGELGQRMSERVVLIMARRNGRYIAGAINFLGSEALYGRNWGCIEHHPFLHFEVCYYQAIDFAIAHKLKRVEAGAQGEHKLARGYRPVLTYSAHDIADPGLRQAIANYLVRERSQVEAAQNHLDNYLPFRKDVEREVE